jgi:hypothetical protein
LNNQPFHFLPPLAQLFSRVSRLTFSEGELDSAGKPETLYQKGSELASRHLAGDCLELGEKDIDFSLNFCYTDSSGWWFYQICP